ncbi:biotin biosynthesis protein BioY [Natrinema saccharevitans]|uniref:Biotin biosynthesis protein BioY n=1 Tax=Natrinema saccharevitans TaxID=301967 RepID=A0A1S8AUB0_9EURY|nr:biotin transporter BioY [Natrinema saccharevitans]OLZ40131.1 biotin biosynthesis protein BioY [Natrinema saccharevitans]
MATERNSVELVDDDAVRSFARAAILAALMGAAAVVGSIPIPFSPIPISLGVLVVYLMGLYLGPYWGTVSIGLYLTAGAIGIPVFANGTAGVGVLLGQTGGYLVAYPLAVLLIGAVVHGTDGLADPADASAPVLVAALLAALIVIYGLGTAWFAYALELGAIEALQLAVVPFVPGDLLKIVAAIVIVKAGHIDPT